ncbi:sugar transferase [Curtobacterium sp. MCSS17_007]|uniref:sugar transferase n=1 Tax=Curtobacterium sp. MCSS17_007 TaxID=2175646 RepID=UPI0015E89DC3|nr:sugar transferase [Curtobacterium sp. MCSS17_007]WIE76085.1 sugar transferase [Curtobacterium sp. MCSS17_007]
MSIAVRQGRAAAAPATVRRPDRAGLSGYARTVAAVDLALLIAASWVAHGIRFPGESLLAPEQPGWLEFVAGPAVIALWMAFLAAFRTREPRIAGVGGEEYRRVLVASLAACATTAVVAYVAQLDLARGYVAIAFPLGTALLALGRRNARAVLARRRARGQHLQDVLVVGDPADVRYVGHRIAATPAAGYRVAAVATDAASGADSGTDSVVLGPDEVPVVGRVDDVLDLATEHGVEAVVVAGAIPGGHERLRRLGWQLEEHGIELVVSSPLADIDADRVHERPVDGLPLMHVETPDYRCRTGKRALDVIGAAVGLLLLAPVFAAVALAIRLDDGGPVLFRQERIGRGGAPFRICKFRTMCIDAEDRVSELDALDEGAGPLFKVRQDPRVTRVGAFLRRTSLDELPQLWNVLTGTMSLVGPRPALPREVAVYEDFADRRLLVTPGMTGLWQVSGRSDLDWAEGVRLDLHYVENWSFLHDVVILARTVPSVLRSRGAY